MTARIELPWKVYFESPHGSPTYNPRTRETRRITSRYFETKLEARTFAGPLGRVHYAPGEAWRRGDA